MGLHERQAPALPKRYLTTAEVCHVYATSPDFLARVSVADLPRNRRGHRSVMFDVMDCERFFATFRVAGDESASSRRPALPAALPTAAPARSPSEAA